MSEAVLVALISGGLSLAGILLSSLLSSRKTETALRISQAVTDTKIDELTREVREHNHFARRMPVVEAQIQAITGQIREMRSHSPLQPQ
jgi:hypothetical protein